MFPERPARSLPPTSWVPEVPLQTQRYLPVSTAMPTNLDVEVDSVYAALYSRSISFDFVEKGGYPSKLIAPLTWNCFLNRWVCQIPLHPGRLLHGDSVRSGGVIERRVEVELETGIKRERVGCHLNHMDLVIALEVDLAEVILVEEVVSHDEA